MVENVVTNPVPSQQPETVADRTARVLREAAIIAQGEAQIDAGLGIDDDELEDWLDALDQNCDAPLPAPTGSVAHR